LEVVTPSWRPHVHDQQTDTVDRAAHTCCVLDQVRTRLRRRDVYAPGSTRLPEVEIADLPPEVHAWTGFLHQYTHISGAETREEGLPESLSALLVSESCNVGLTPVAEETYPPLTRERRGPSPSSLARALAEACLTGDVLP